MWYTIDIVNRTIRYSLFLCFFIFLFCVCQAETLTGIWENNERFIEYKQPPDTSSSGLMRIVLKTYYRYVYEDMGEYPVVLTPAEHTEHIYQLNIRYPHVKKQAETRIWVHKGRLFSSFYEKIPYTESSDSQVNNQTAVSQERSEATQQNLLNGFWVEAGHRKGILIYPQESPEFFDAFFFMGTSYIKFRYWKGDLDYRQKQAEFRHTNGKRISVPKLMKRSGAVYSCITSNGSKLKNYEKGICSITSIDGTLQLTLKPAAGGPGTHAVGDTYPHHQYPRLENIPLYYDEADRAFSFGTPFLTRSSIPDLQAEISKHNSLKRPPPEPLLKADELDFYWERIKEIRGEKDNLLP